jgi:hypothetical protein
MRSARMVLRGVVGAITVQHAGVRWRADWPEINSKRWAVWVWRGFVRH